MSNQQILQENKSENLFIGKDIDGKDIIVDTYSNPHLVICGSARNGTKVFMKSLIDNLVKVNTKEKMELHIIQCNNGRKTYEATEHVQSYATNINYALTVLQELRRIIIDREELMYQGIRDGIIYDIKQYNEVSDDKLPMIYVVVDNYTTLIYDTNDTKESREVKKKIRYLLQEIVQYGNKVGIQLIVSAEKPTPDRIPPFIISQACTKILFNQYNQSVAELIINNDSKFIHLEDFNSLR